MLVCSKNDSFILRKFRSTNMDLFAMTYEEPVKTNVVNCQCRQVISVLFPIYLDSCSQ